MEKKKRIELSEPVLNDAFGLERLRETDRDLHKDFFALVNTWLRSDGTLDEIEKHNVQVACNELINNVDHWNEEELKMHFISPIVRAAKFGKSLQVLFDREISAEIDGILVKSEADMIVAKGSFGIIKVPYFFLHEYKREKKYSGDPMGQMLGGMLIAQAKNNDGKPVFGGYVQGRYWFFSVLDGKKYHIAESIDASRIDGARKVVFVLRAVKGLVEGTQN